MNTERQRTSFASVGAYRKSVRYSIAGNRVALLRCAIGVVFLWFGVLKLFPGSSPAEALAGKTILILSFGFVKPVISVPLLGLLATILGITLVSGRAVKIAIGAMLAHMAGTLTPLLLLPHDTFSSFPFQPNLTGQYILKNFVLIAGALVVASATTSTPRSSEEILRIAA